MHDTIKALIRWGKYFENVGIKQQFQSKYIKYVRELSRKDLPIIFEFNHLAALLGRTKVYLASAVNSSESHYRSFNLPKRNGGFREILAPYPALLECQRWINNFILPKIGVHECCHGFVKNSSIISNAKPHLNQKTLLHMDIKNFFHSINKKRVLKIFRTAGYSPNVAFYLASLCCCGDMVPQGAATSPSISNIIAFGLDVRLSKLAKSYSLIFTRYADDLTFSGDYIPYTFIKIVDDIIKDYGFKVNDKKTYLSLGPGKRIVTGLSVVGSELKVPRKYKRKLRQEVYYIVNHGYDKHIRKKKISDPFYLNSIYGKLLFWKSVEPKNLFVLKSIENISQILQISKKDHDSDHSEH